MKRSVLLALFALVVALGAMTSAAQAQATRTWVSGVGDDANPCSRTAPCKTFAGAISKTTDCGEIDALDPGGFGNVTITKSITIDGGGGEAGQVASILVSGTPGIVINVTSSVCTFVVIRNLDINGINTGTIGISAVAGGRVSLENIDVAGFTQQCVNFQPVGTMTLVMYGTNLENCAAGGIAISSAGSVRANIEKSTIQRNGAGGKGVEAGQNSFVSIHDSMIADNKGGGVEASGATAALGLDLCTVDNNQVLGVHSGLGATVSMTNTSVAWNNGPGILADGGAQFLTGNNNWLYGNNPNGTRTGLLDVQ
jgi:hypothetical protein